MGNQVPEQPWSGENAALWDKILFADKVCPGVAVVKVKRGNKFDEKKSKGSHGGGREYTGADNAKVTITIRMLSNEEDEEFNLNILPILEPTIGKKKLDSVAIGHPVAAVRKVAAITVDDVDGPDVSNHQILYTVSATEFREPDKKNASGKITGGGKKFSGGGNCAEMKRAYDQLGVQLAADQQALAQVFRERGTLQQRNASFGGALSKFDDRKTPGTDLQSEIEQNRRDEDQLTAKTIDYTRQQQSILQQMVANRCNLSPPSGDPKVTGEA